MAQRQANAAQRQTETADRGLLNDRYQKATEMLRPGSGGGTATSSETLIAEDQINTLRPDLPTDIEPDGHQARSGLATLSTSCSWTTWATCPRKPRGGAALHSHRRTLRTAVPGHNVKPGLLPVGAHLRQPHVHRGGHRPGGPSFGHPGIRRPQRLVVTTMEPRS